MAQYGRPISDISTGNWATTPLWSDLDDNLDADYITSGKNPAADTFENALTSTLSDPSSSSGHIVRARLYCSKANNGTATVYVYQGTTLIATYAIPGNLATAFTTYSYTLTGTEADNITDYTVLRIRVVANGTANAYVYCAWTELEIPDPVTATEESVSLAKFKGVSSPVTYAGAPVSLSLAKFAGQTAAELGNVQETAALNRVNTVVPSTLISGEEVVNLNRVGTIAPSAFGIFDQSASMARSIGLTVLEDFTSTIQEAVSLSRLLAAAAKSQEVSIEEVNLAKVAAVSTASQLVAYSATSLNRINTIPANTLGTLYELVNLAHLDGLSVLEETQGQTNESVTLTRVLSVLAETLEEGNEDVSLAYVLGLISDSQEISQETVGLGASHGLSVLEETQGSIEENVTLTRLMGVVSSSQAVMQDGLALNRYFTLGAASKHVAMDSVIFDSTYGLSSAAFPQISELVPLTRVNTISLADNVTTFEAVNLLLSLLITAEPSSIFEISQIHDNNVLFVKYRDKRYRVIFRDKRG